MITITIAKGNKIKNGNMSAYIKFPYNQRIVDEIRSYPFR